MARWNHNSWTVAAFPLVEECVMTVGFSIEAKKARNGVTYRRYRIDVGGEALAFGNAFAEDGRIAIRLETPLLGIKGFEFATDQTKAALPGTGRMKRNGSWEALSVLPPC